MAGSEARLETLQRRLNEEPGSRVFVSVAEEYRKLGRLREAIKTLSQGLELQPGYLAARVALGRTQLEAGLSEDGIRTLETVVRTDRTQMVACRLLIGAYGDAGQSEPAVRMLEQYRLLNPQDPELDLLAQRARGEASAAPADPGPERPSLESRTGEAESDDRPLVEQLADSSFLSREVLPESDPVPPEASVQEADDTLAALMRESGERVIPTRESGAGMPDEVLALNAAEGAPASAADAPASAGDVPGRPGDAPGRPGDQDPAVPQEDSDPEAVPDLGPAAALEFPAIDDPEARSPMTTTLAEVYLRQGHRREAAEIYRALLEVDPAHEKAREGLKRLEDEEAAAIDPNHLLVERRRAALERYLETLHAARNRPRGGHAAS